MTVSLNGRSSTLDVDADTNSLVLDRSIERMQNERIVEAGKVRCETTLDKIRILFTAENLRPTLFEGEAALRADIPPSLIRLQRRAPATAGLPRPAARVPAGLGSASSSACSAGQSC